MVKPIKMGSQYKPKSMDFEGMIGSGQNPKGFTAEVVNGTAHYGNNPGWNQRRKYSEMPAEKIGPWANGNRTGE